MRTPTDQEKRFTQLELAEAADAPPHTILRDPLGSRIITSDIKTGDIRYEIKTDGGEVKFE